MDLDLQSKFLIGKTSKTSAIIDASENGKPREGVFYYDGIMYVIIIDRADFNDIFAHRDDIINIHDISSEKITKCANISELYINIINKGEYQPVVSAYQKVAKYMDDISGLHEFMRNKLESTLLNRVVKQNNLKSSFDLFARKNDQSRDIYITKKCNENFTIKISRKVIDKNGCIDRNDQHLQYHIDVLYLMLCDDPNIGIINYKKPQENVEFEYSLSAANPVTIGNEIFTTSCGIFYKTRRICSQIRNESEFTIPYTFDECVNFLQCTGQHQSAEYIKTYLAIAGSALLEFRRRY